MKFLTFAQLKTQKGVPYTRRHLRDLCKEGKFPKPVELCEARIAWVEGEVDAWLSAKVALRGTTYAPRRELAGVAARKPKPDAKKRKVTAIEGISTSGKTAKAGRDGPGE